MARTRPAPGGGIVVEVGTDRLAGWVNRFAGRNDGLAAIEADPDGVLLTAVDGTTARLAVPFPPMQLGQREPLEALISHLDGLGAVGLVAVRAGAHSVGVARHRVVLASRTDRAHLQGRTAAGGWSQQRFARRRGNQRRASLDDAARDVAEVVLPVVHTLDALVTAGDAAALETVLADPRLARLAALPRRTFGDIAEPRRVVLDELAGRLYDVEITVREATI